jgi:LEA14-like dessication related protein
MKKALLYITGISIIGYSLYKYYNKQIDFIKEITYKIVGLRIVTFTKNKIDLDISLQIYNGSDVSATVTQMFLDVFINDVIVGNINEIKDIVINANKSSLITYRFSFNPELIIKNIVNLLSFTIAAKDITFEAKGYMNLKSGFLQTTIPFKYKNNLKTMLNLK